MIVVRLKNPVYLRVLFFALLFAPYLMGQSDGFEGTWQGVVIRKGTAIEKGTLLYADFKLTGEDYEGHTREEGYESPYFSVKKLSGTVEGGHFVFRHSVEIKSKKSSRIRWCRFAADLVYDEETGYLSGTYESTDCKRVLGTIILYRSNVQLSTLEDTETSHMWFAQFVKDYKEGLSAPEIRKKERENFVFEPIFFDYDKDSIRDEYTDFLDRIIRVVKGHSDLRIKVTGHTDSDGSDAYNDTLSMRRSEAIVNYFVSRGLDRNRIVIDFKGEKQPADTNTTSEGKQRNRRVDFEFI